MSISMPFKSPRSDEVGEQSTSPPAHFSWPAQQAWLREQREIESDAIRAFDFHDFMEMEPEERIELLGGWLFAKCLAMVHAWRGTGKTWWAMAVAYAVAAGGSFLEWRSPSAQVVVYIDGEMPADVLKSRFEMIAAMSDATPAPGFLQIISADLQDRPMPNLATPQGQTLIDSLIGDGVKLIIVDNISCMVRGEDENDATSWTRVSEWALRHRREGRAVLFVHHSGKTGKQRGTSKREDLLDVVIGLRRPLDYDEADGAVFEVHFEKARTIHGDAVEPIEARLVTENGHMSWSVRPVVAANTERIMELWDLGQNVTTIASEVGLHKSNVTRSLQKAAENQKLKRPYPPQRQKPRNNP